MDGMVRLKPYVNMDIHNITLVYVEYGIGDLKLVVRMYEYTPLYEGSIQQKIDRSVENSKGIIHHLLGFYGFGLEESQGEGENG